MPYKLILMDGSAFLFRAYFATLAQNLTNEENFPTGAMFGVVNAIKHLQRQYSEAKIIAIFDAKGKNFRHEMYPQYKAHRKPTDEALKIQIEPLYEIIRSMGLSFVCTAGVEADDVIATLSKRAKEQNIKTIIASSDKDLYQLVGDGIYQLNMHGKLLDEEEVIDKIGVAPDKVLDLLALTGDSADNIPGVPSVGPKTAIKWLTEYGDIAQIKQNMGQIKGKVGEQLRNNINLLDLSYQLVQLKFDVDLGDDIFTNELKQDTAKLAELYKKYNFSMWLKQLGDVGVVQHEDNVKSSDIVAESLIYNYQQEVIFTDNEFAQLLQKLNNSKVFVFDLETNSLDYLNAKIVGLVFLVDELSFYLPVAHDYLGAPKQLSLEFVLSKLEPILTNKNINKVGQNLKYDAHVLANYNIDLLGIGDDTMIKSYCLNSVASRHNMDALSMYYLNHKTISFSDVAGSGKKQLSFNEVSMEEAAPYACEDVIVTHELNKELEVRISQHPTLVSLYQKLELPIIKVLLRIERNGVKLDTNALLAQQIDVVKQIRAVKEKIFAITDTEFNLDSPKQIQQILFSEEGLGLEAKKKTPKGQPSTNEEALALLEHPLAALILNYRALTKINSTYLEALPKQVDLHTNRLHTSYHQAVTATGRLSSSNPNLQNIPIQTEQGARIREAFIADKGRIIIAADYSQIELRIMAHLSKDSNLLAAFNNNLDVHSATAATIFSVPIKEVSKEQRRSAKAVNFGLIYGMSAFGLAKQIGVSRTEAKEYIDAYFANYPSVLEYMDNIKNIAKQQGYVETIVGRRLYIPEINSKNKMRQQHAMRTAINAPMQGSAADIIKTAMLDIDKFIGADNDDIKMIMQVHDELVFEVDANQKDYFIDKIQRLMTDFDFLDVPLVVDIGTGDNWRQAH